MQQSHSRQAFSVSAEEVEGYASQETETENIPLVTLDFPQHCYQEISKDISFHRISSSSPLPILFVACCFAWSPKLCWIFFLLGLRNFSILFIVLLWIHFTNYHLNYPRSDFPKISPPCAWYISFFNVLSSYGIIQEV